MKFEINEYPWNIIESLSINIMKDVMLYKKLKANCVFFCILNDIV